MEQGEQCVAVLLEEVNPDAHRAPVRPGDPGDAAAEFDGLCVVGGIEPDQDRFAVPEGAVSLGGEPTQSQIDDLCAYGSASPVGDNDRPQSHRKPLMRSVIPLSHTDRW